MFTGVAAETNSASSNSNSVPRIKAALEQATLEKDVDKRLRRLEELGGSLSLSEVREALDAGDSLKELRERMVFKQSALIHWSELAPEEAFTQIAKLPESQLKAAAFREATARFARKSPDRAAAAVAGLSLSRSRNDMIELVANIWAQTNAAGALEWADRLLPAPAKESAVQAILFVWVQTDPVAASARVEKLEASRTRNNLVANVAYNWAARDPEAAIRWANKLTDEADRSAASTSIAESWANRDPRAAGAYALKLPAQEIRSQAGANVALRWARQNPRQAADWLWNGDEDIRGKGLKEVLDLWAGVDVAGCAKWIEALPAGSDRDQAVAAFVSPAAMWAPEVAARESLLIGDEGLRLVALDECVPHWQEVDPVAATNWLNQTKQLDGFKARWLNATPAR